MSTHVFQPYPVDMLEVNPFIKLGREWALLTTGNKQEANTMTVAWGGFGVIWGKNTVTVYVRESRYSKKLIDEGDFFSLAFVGNDSKEALNYCGSHSGREGDKFAAAGLTASFRHSIPYPDEANLVFLCKKMAAVPLTEETFTDKEILQKWYRDNDMHTMYIGEIIEVLAR